MAIMSGLQWYLKNDNIFPILLLFFLLFQFPMSIDSWINSSSMATNNDLLMEELNVSHFAPKLWLYVMIWLPRTTDNSTQFAQSLEIRGIESRLYIDLHKNDLLIGNFFVQIGKKCRHLPLGQGPYNCP